MALNRGLQLVWWAVVVVVGWSGYYLAGGGGDAGSAAGQRAASWLLGIPLALVVGLLLLWGLERWRRPSPAGGIVVLAVAAWGAANAVGWTVDVTVGGPATGLVTGCVLTGAHLTRSAPAVGSLRLRLLAVIAAGTAAMVLGRVLSGFDAFLPRVVLPVLFGTAAALVVWRWLRLPAPFRPIAILMVGWTLSWLVGFEIALRLPAELPAAVYVVVELGLACAAGGFVTGLVERRLIAEGLVAVTARWAALSVGGTVLGMVLAEVVWALGPVPSRVLQAADLWAAGTTFGLALGAGHALLPTVARAAARDGVDRDRSLTGDRP